MLTIRLKPQTINKAFASGFPLHKRTMFQGLGISIENRKGSYREDKQHDPPQWRNKMYCDYGYIRGTEGVDHDHEDCFIGQNKDAVNAYIVHQLNPSTGKFDEEKVMLGFDSAQDAKKMYLKHYDSPKFFGGIKEMSMDRFIPKVLLTLKRGGDIIKALR